LDDILGLADVRAKDKLQAKRKAAVGLDRFVGDAARGDDEDPRSLIRVDSTWRPPPGFVARDDLEHEAKLGGFHIDAVVVSFDELLTICVEMWHAQNKENMVRLLVVGGLLACVPASTFPVLTMISHVWWLVFLASRLGVCCVGCLGPQSNLRELFHAFDDDGNGVLSFGEFEKLIVACVDRDLPQRQIATLFDEVCVDVWLSMRERDFPFAHPCTWRLAGTAVTCWFRFCSVLFCFVLFRFCFVLVCVCVVVLPDSPGHPAGWIRRLHQCHSVLCVVQQARHHARPRCQAPRPSSSGPRGHGVGGLQCPTQQRGTATDR